MSRVLLSLFKTTDTGQEKRKYESNMQLIFYERRLTMCFILSRWCNVHFSLLGMSRIMTRDFGHFGTMVIHLVQLFYEWDHVSLAQRVLLYFNQACVLHTTLFWHCVLRTVQQQKQPLLAFPFTNKDTVIKRQTHSGKRYFCCVFLIVLFLFLIHIIHVWSLK